MMYRYPFAPDICYEHTINDKSMAWSPDGKWLAWTSFERVLCLWSFVNRDLQQLDDRRNPSPGSVVWSPDGTQLAVSHSSAVDVWYDIGSSSPRKTLELEHFREVMSVAWSPDGKQLASAEWTVIRIWSMMGSPLIPAIMGQLTTCGSDIAVDSLVWSCDGTRVAVIDETSVRIWSVDSFTLCFRSDDVKLIRFAWSPDGHRLALANRNTVHVWSHVWDESRRRRCIVKQKQVKCLAWSPDGKWLALNQFVYSMEDMAAEPRHIFPHGKSVVAWSPDGKRVASASESDGFTIRVVGSMDDGGGASAAAAESRVILKGHTRPVYSIVWSPDGRRMASSSMDQTVRIWEVPMTMDEARSVAVRLGILDDWLKFPWVEELRLRREDLVTLHRAWLDRVGKVPASSLQMCGDDGGASIMTVPDSFHIVAAMQAHEGAIRVLEEQIRSSGRGDANESLG